MEPQKLIRSGVANDAGKLRPTLRHCLEATLSIADSMIDEMLERLALVLNPNGVVPLPAELQGVDLLEVVRWIDHADDIKHTWSGVLRQVFFHGDVQKVDVRLVVRFDELCLLDDEQIDASIEFAMVEQILANATGELLPRLNALVSNLMGWLTVQPDLNPLRPAAYARALHAVMVEHMVDAQQRKVLIVPLANILGTSLSQVYREVIQWLMAHGVQPLQVSNPMAPAGPETPSAVGRTMLTLGRLRQLLAGDFNESAVGGPAEMLTVPASLSALEDMDLIEPLMQRLRQRPVAVSHSTPMAQLPVVSGHNLGRLLGQEVVRLMLENLTHDERLLPTIRQQIGLLAPSLSRLSQTEPRFFSDRQHPARQLLEAMAQRSLGFLSHNDEGFSDFLKSVRSAVKSIDKVEATDEKYALLLKRLRRRWEEDDERKNQRRAEAARALLHAEQRQVLAERLAIDFQGRMLGKELPEFVQRFVCGPWAQAVAELQLADAQPGDLSPTEATDDLIWSAQPNLVRRDVDRLARLLPRLLGQLRHGLQRINYPATLTSHFFDALVNLHQKAIEIPGPVPGVVEPSGAPLPVGPVSELDATDMDSQGFFAQETFWMADQEAQDAGFVGTASEEMPSEPEDMLPTSPELATGAWVNLKAQGEWVRAQLTWTSPRGGLYMFISASGMAHSMTRRTLERLQASGAVQTVSSGGVVESALDAVAQQALRNTQIDQAEPGQPGEEGSPPSRETNP